MKTESGRNTGRDPVRPTPVRGGRPIPGGDPGRETAAMAAILVVSAATVTALALLISGHPGPTAVDRWALDVAGLMRAGWLDSVTGVVTWLGSTAVLLPLIAVTLTLLVIGRRWIEAVVLLLSALTIVVGVDWLKHLIERPRPDGAIIAVPGYSFPSGHAAHSVFYLWLAITVTVRIRPDLPRKAAVIAAGAGLTVVIGLTRVYLEVHYLSDVTAGWALGVFCFAFFTLAALLSVRLRNNSGS